MRRGRRARDGLLDSAPLTAEMPMKKPKKPTVSQRRQAEDAVRTLLRWAGEDPEREGLLDTPKRVVDAYRDWFSGYATDPHDYLRARSRKSPATTR